MAEYIEREALLKDISESVVFTVRGDSPSLEIRGANKVTDRIKSAPAADVVEVVRCKDCEYLLFDTKYCKLHNRGYCKFDDTIKQPNHFCGYGTRKEGAEE